MASTGVIDIYLVYQFLRRLATPFTKWEAFKTGVIDKEGKGQLAGFEGPSCEDAGLLKLDVLGIKMLDKIMEIPTIIKNTYRMTV